MIKALRSSMKRGTGASSFYGTTLQEQCALNIYLICPDARRQHGPARGSGGSPEDASGHSRALLQVRSALCSVV